MKPTTYATDADAMKVAEEYDQAVDDALCPLSYNTHLEAFDCYCLREGCKWWVASTVYSSYVEVVSEGNKWWKIQYGHCGGMHP